MSWPRDLPSEPDWSGSASRRRRRTSPRVLHRAAVAAPDGRLRAATGIRPTGVCRPAHRGYARVRAPIRPGPGRYIHRTARGVLREEAAFNALVEALRRPHIHTVVIASLDSVYRTMRAQIEAETGADMLVMTDRPGSAR